ncbi:hypothetical protein F2Q69_00022953 [Brassica cretica]|uniref:Uncharacterized protein n=1 Tax=Brassica cretica TaxID=69181 RepID=A0A8S9PUS9_BRACR|nr:hypothetical protein F2Q69_00022953 [Brassica cretica]
MFGTVQSLNRDLVRAWTGQNVATGSVWTGRDVATWSVHGPVATLRPDPCGLVARLVATLRPCPCVARSQRCDLICVYLSQRCDLVRMLTGRNVASWSVLGSVAMR